MGDAIIVRTTRVQADQGAAAPSGGAWPVNVVAGSAGGTEYTEGDTDATITGAAILWEDAADTLRAVSTGKPLPVAQQGNVGVTATNLDVRDLASSQDSVEVKTVAGVALNLDAAGDVQVDVKTMPTTTVTADNLDIRDLTSVSDSVAVKTAGGVALNLDAAGDVQVDVKTMPTTTVTATDLDIRNLASSQDNVEVKTAGGVALNLDAAGDVQADIKTEIPVISENNVGITSTALSTATTGVTGGTLNAAVYRKFLAMLNLTRSGATSDVLTISPQWSDDGGTTWYTLQDGPFGNLLFTGTAIGGGLNLAMTGDAVGDDMRWIASCGTLSASSTFTVQARITFKN